MHIRDCYSHHDGICSYQCPMAVLVIVVVMELPFLRNVLLIMLNVGVILPHKLQLLLQQV